MRKSTESAKTFGCSTLKTDNAASARFAILVVSCDRYCSLWSIFFERLRRFWPDCDYPVYLLSNTVSFSADGVRVILTHEDRDWSSNLQVALSQIDADYVLLMLDDAPLDGPISNSRIYEFLREMTARNMRHLNLKARPRGQISVSRRFKQYATGVSYRASVCPCIWDKRTLLELLVPGETAWQFEIRGSRRSDAFEEFYVVEQPVLDLIHIIIKGKVDRRAYAKLSHTGEISEIEFPQMSTLEFVLLRLKELRSTAVDLLPFRARTALRRWYFGRLRKMHHWV